MAEEIQRDQGGASGGFGTKGQLHGSNAENGRRPLEDDNKDEAPHRRVGGYVE